MRIRLPNGLVDGGDWFNYAVIDELRGKQQNYLANRELVLENIGHVPKIIEDMLISLETSEGLPWKGDKKEAIGKLPSGDLETILIRVRENTFGPKYIFEAECESCGHKNKDLKLLLNDLELDCLTLEELTSKKSFELPKSKIEVELKPTYLEDLFKVIKLSSGEQDSLITSIIAISVKRMKLPLENEEFEWKETIKSEDIDDIPVSDLAYLQDKVEEIRLEGDIDTDIEVDCKGCGETFVTKLNCYSPFFFSPTKGSMK